MTSMNWIAALIIILCIGVAPASACTIIKASKDGRTLIGCNEDGPDRTTHLWFLPSSKGKFGRVYFTLGDKWPQAGMNDQGLFYDGTSGPWKDIVGSRTKPIYRGNLAEKMLESSATVAEALTLLKAHNLSYFSNGQTLVADRFGNSAIVEGDHILIGQKAVQIATNFYQSQPTLGGFPCHRYDIAQAMIENDSRLTMDTLRLTLRAVHLEGFSFTQYSTIADLNLGRIRYFKDADFSQWVEIDLHQELRHGERWFETARYFSQRPIQRANQSEAPFFPNTLVTRHPGGKTRCMLHFSKNQLHGLSFGTHQNGQRAWQASFIKGKPQGELRFWDAQGRPRRGYAFVDDLETQILEDYPSGKAHVRVTIRKLGVDGMLPTALKVCNEDGSLSYQGQFKNGLLHLDGHAAPVTATLKSAFASGRSHTETQYLKGKPHGETRRWDAHGKLLEIETYQEGSLVSVKRF